MTALEEYNRIAALYDEPGSRCKNHDFTIARAAIAELEADLAAMTERFDALDLQLREADEVYVRDLATAREEAAEYRSMIEIAAAPDVSIATLKSLLARYQPGGES